MKFRRIVEVLCLQGLQKKLWAHFHDLCVQKWSCFLRFSNAFRKLLPCEVYEKRFGRIITTFASKAKLFALEFRRILEILCMQGLQKKFWAYFHDLCVQKWSCFLRCSDAFRKFSPFEVYEKSSGRIVTNFASKNEAVCLGVQKYFGNSLPAILQKSFWAHIHDFCVEKRSCLPWSSDAFWKFSAFKVYKRFLGAFSRFLRRKTKLFFVKFKGILEVFSMQALWKRSWHNFTINASKNVTVCREVQTHFGTSLLPSVTHKMRHLRVT